MTEVESATRTDPAPDDNDDWLYGDGNETANPADEAPSSNKGQNENAGNDVGKTTTGEEEGEGEPADDDEHFVEDGTGAGQTRGNGDMEDIDSDSDSDDEVKVTIGDIKAGPQQYPSLNIKRGGIVPQAAADKQKSVGKFTVEDFESIGTINGVPAIEYNIDSLEDKPWNKPGADISDYFNYGLTEATWRAYCDRQRRMRLQEAGVPLHGSGGGAGGGGRGPPLADQRRHQHSLPSHGMMRMDDIPHQHNINNIPVRESTIQVMTADRREYSRSKFPDLSLPPPGPDYFPPPPPGPDYYPAHPAAPPYHEPHWNHNEMGGGGAWAPTEIKELTPGPMGGAMGPPPPGMAPPSVPPQVISQPPAHYYGQVNYHERERDRDRDRERDRLREREDRDRRDRRDDDKDDRDERGRSHSVKPDRDRHRDRSHRRERSRSRSRRHKSRSRSPRQRDRERERSVKSKAKESSRKEKEDEE